MKFTTAAVALRAVVLVLSMIAVFTPAAAEDVRELQWADLVEVVTFDDPFEALTPRQLGDLSRVARIRGLQVAQGYVDEGLAEELAQATARLQADGIDIDGLLARREEVRQLRARRANAVVDDLDGRYVRLPGYIVPLEFSDSRIIEFLLVPWFGACIHTPPPPASQIVHVCFDQGLAVWDDSAPFWVQGRMSVESTRKDLFLVDGSADVDVGYAPAPSTAMTANDSDSNRDRRGESRKICTTIGPRQSWVGELKLTAATVGSQGSDVVAARNKGSSS